VRVTINSCRHMQGLAGSFAAGRCCKINQRHSRTAAASNVRPWVLSWVPSMAWPFLPANGAHQPGQLTVGAWLSNGCNCIAPRARIIILPPNLT
jgi:hypothetical protein